MSYAPIYAAQVEALRREMGARSTDEAIEILEREVIALRELYEVPPKLHRKAEVHQYERDRD